VILGPLFYVRNVWLERPDFIGKVVPRNGINPAIDFEGLGANRGFLIEEEDCFSYIEPIESD